jgi:hypothetical protein
MNKICTSIEQSKKLIELGIDVNTADMFWDLLDGDDLPSGTYTKWEYACEAAIKYCLENLI